MHFLMAFCSFNEKSLGNKLKILLLIKVSGVYASVSL